MRAAHACVKGWSLWGGYRGSVSGRTRGLLKKTEEERQDVQQRECSTQTTCASTLWSTVQRQGCYGRAVQRLDDPPILLGAAPCQVGAAPERMHVLFFNCQLSSRSSLRKTWGLLGNREQRGWLPLAAQCAALGSCCAGRRAFAAGSQWWRP
jgi:hypothetical protein